MHEPRWLLLASSSLLLALSVGCSANGGTRRDTGVGTADTSVPTDTSVPPRDSMVTRRDIGPPPVDAGCESMTPIETMIIGDPPDMLLTVDISGSMCTPLIDRFPPSMTTKLTIMKAALDTLVTSKDARINFGLMLFPQGGACGAGTVRDPIAPRNAPAITATVGALVSDFFGCATRNTGATPTGISLDAARAYYGTIPVNPIGRYVLLATDGLPNCGAVQPDGSTAETVDETVAAITALSAAGINTYVLGFGSDISGGGDALRRMATAGGTGTPFNAASAAELDAALDMIAADVIPPSCVVELDGPVRDASLFQVSFDGGALISRDEAHASGWDYDPGTNTITFYGPECATLQAGGVASVDVDFGCPGPLI